MAGSGDVVLGATLMLGVTGTECNSKPLKAEVRGTAVLRLLHEKGNTNNASNCLLSNHFFSRPTSLSFLALLVACDNVILSLKGTEA